MMPPAPSSQFGGDRDDPADQQRPAEPGASIRPGPVGVDATEDVVDDSSQLLGARGGGKAGQLAGNQAACPLRRLLVVGERYGVDRRGRGRVDGGRRRAAEAARPPSAADLGRWAASGWRRLDRRGGVSRQPARVVEAGCTLGSARTHSTGHEPHGAAAIPPRIIAPGRFSGMSSGMPCGLACMPNQHQAPCGL
jgi:hypothetical protein